MKFSTLHYFLVLSSVGSTLPIKNSSFLSTASKDITSVLHSLNDTNYEPMQFLNGSIPIPQNADPFDISGISSDLFDNITKYASLVSLVDCVKNGTVSAGKEIFHVLAGDISGYFMKDSTNKQLWAVFGTNPSISTTTNLVNYIPKIVSDGLNKVDFSCLNCMVQEGEMLAMDIVLKDLPIFLREVAINPNYSIYIAGNAFGAGLAALSGNEVTLAGNIVNIITFGGAKFADIALAEYMDQHYGKTIPEDLATYNNNTYLRVTADNDPTPLFPISLTNFAHSGANIHIKNDIKTIADTVLRGTWTPANDGLIVKSLNDVIRNTLKATSNFVESLIPSMAIFTGNLLCPVNTYI